MRLVLYTLLCIVTVGVCSCQTQEKGVILQEGVGSDNLANNVVTRPVIHAFSALIGEGIEIRQAVSYVNKDGFMQLDVNGYNKSFQTRRFEYKVEWLDASGLLIDSATNKWLLTSAAGKSPFTIKAIAPRTGAVDFRLNTRIVK
ncbi:MAG: YcfL family protein [Planctomycetota bacterium]